jgi:hypothetical protein
MPDVTPLLLRVCSELGLLALRDLYIEVALLADDRAFTTAELAAHASLPENGRLRAAIEAACGEVSARKLGKIFAKWEGVDIASLQADCIGSDPAGILWRVSPAKPIPDRTPVADCASIVALPPVRTRHAV